MPIEIRNSRGVYIVPSGDDVIFVSEYYKECDWAQNSVFATLRDLLLQGF